VIDLRQYQLDVIERCREQIRLGKNRICLVAPTGSGKTIIASAIIKSAGALGKSIVLLAHTREIIGQTSRKLHALDVSHGILAAELTRGSYHSVQIASVQTFHSRVVRRKIIEPPPADFLFMDECHHLGARTWREILSCYPGVPLIGLTATPCRGDGRGLGEIFDVLLECPQVPDLIKAGYLVGTKTFAPRPPDLRGVAVQAGDYVVNQLGRRMNTDELVGDVVTNWLKHASGKKTIVFAVNVGHSRHLADSFVEAGIAAEHVDGSTPSAERDGILARLASGTTTVVCNCRVLTEGFDLPDIQCLILARPTRHLGLYRQMVGRGLRPAEGKSTLTVLDHSGAIYAHGPVEDIVEWTLESDKRAVNQQHVADRKVRDGDGEFRSRLVDCKGCGAKRIAGTAHCGYFPKRPPSAVVFQDDDLARYDAVARRVNIEEYGAEAMAQWHAMLLWIQRDKGYSPKYAAASFKNKFGVWPPFTTPKPMPPSAEVKAWVRSRLIAWRKGKAKAAA
jgi:DNA repair protein RadD